MNEDGTKHSRKGAAKKQTGVKRKQKDTFFGSLFSEKEYFVDLYRAVSGKNITPNDIERFDLSSPTVSRPFKNDVSFLTIDNRLLIFAEHQSTNNANMALRELLYFAESLYLWLSQNKLDLTKGNKIEVPMPEFYVAYNGVRKMKQDTLTFGNEFLQVVVKFTNINFDQLQDQTPGNSLAGYSYFYKEFREHIAKKLSPKKAFVHAREKCIEQGYLKGIVDKEDFVVNYMPLIDREEMIRAGTRLDTAEEMFRAAVESGVSKEALNNLARVGGLSEEQINEIYNEIAEDKNCCVAR